MIRNALIAAVVCCACKDSVIPVATVRGTYTLRTVDGAPLPQTISTANGVITAVVADSITLMENNIFHEAGAQTVTGTGATNRTSNYGTYGFLSTSVTLHSDVNGVDRSGRLEGDTMTILEPGHVEIYQKLH